jgi:CMP-N,N'-diacetyllegionaminic acid synthase
MRDKVLCLVPARSGSKGVPNKNIRPLLGEPLMAHTIHAALTAKRSLELVADFEVVVSSDSEDYLKVATGLGVTTIVRPDEIAKDATPMVEVVRHALEHFEVAKGVQYQTIMLLQPTCPARQAWHVEDAYRLYRRRSMRSLVSVVLMEDAHPARMYTKDKDDFGHSLQANDSTRNRQELPPVYHRNGAIYLCDKSLVEQNRLISENPILYEMEKKYSINIDDEVDWIYAEALCKFLQRS